MVRSALARARTALAARFGARLPVALAAGLAAVAGSYLAVGFTRRFVAAAVAGTVLAFMPEDLLVAGILTLRDLAQPLLVVGSALLWVLVVAGVVLLVFETTRDEDRERAEEVFGAFLGAGFVTFLVTVSPVSALAAGLGAGLVVGVAGRAVNREGVSPERRSLLKAGGLALSLSVVGLLVRFRPGGGSAASRDAAGSGGGRTGTDPQVRTLLETARERSLPFTDIDGLVSTGFYQVDIATANPRVDREAWSLTVDGAVETELDLSFADIESMPAEHRFVTLRCVSDTVNGRKLDNALWTGVPVAELLDRAGAPDACCVTLHCADDYFVSFPRQALEPGLLAYRMNGLSLPRGHGYPLRTLVPGHWGETNGKWLERIEVHEEPATGYWERRGWHGTGPVNTVAKLHHVQAGSGRVTLGGHAYAGTRGVQAVEVSTDGGETWSQATLSEPLPGAVPADGETVDVDGKAADAWRMWSFEYQASEQHEVVVRAVDGTGTVQPKRESQPFPRGATGWVRDTVTP